MAILFLRECTVENVAHARGTGALSRCGLRCSVFGRLVYTGSRVGNYPRHKTIPWNARHTAFRPAHFRYVITSILSSQSRHPRVCLRDLTPSFAANSRPVAAFARPMRLSPINYAPFRPRNQKFIIAPIVFDPSLPRDRPTGDPGELFATLESLRFYEVQDRLEERHYL